MLDIVEKYNIAVSFAYVTDEVKANTYGYCKQKMEMPLLEFFIICFASTVRLFQEC